VRESQVTPSWLLILGLARASGTAASLLLNAELVLTLLVAGAAFREAIGPRVVAAALLIALGGGTLGFEPAAVTAPAPGLGALFVLLACLSWAIENNLTHAIAHRDPFAIVRWKGLTAGTASLAIAGAAGISALPPARTIAALLALGAVGYGASIVLYTYAQRALGAGRTAAYYGLAPFLGAAVAIGLGDPLTPRVAAAGLAMAGAAWLLLAERHGHLHIHVALEHEHRHVHDAHHQHAHRGDEGPEPHSHPHAHEPLEHEHEHAPDLHHRHDH